jgi:signal peptidase I
MKLAKVAAVVAFLTAGLAVAAAITQQVVALPLAAIPLAAGIGIWRKRVWGAYGFALFQVAQLLLLPVIWVRSSDADLNVAETIFSAVFMIAYATLFFLAGRSLSAAGSKRGLAWPWISVAALCTVPLIFLQPFVIPSGAMENTLLIGDHLFVQRLPNPAPARDSMVVFHYPIDRREVHVKRIIGMPGDRIHLANKTVYRNGAPLTEPYAVHETNYVDAYRDNFPGQPNATLQAPAVDMLSHHVVDGEVVVPDGCYFVLGDNRDDSLDSRYFGFVAAGDLIGRPRMIYYSVEPSKHVRWNRMFKAL